MIFKGEASQISIINELANKNGLIRFDKGSPGLPVFNFSGKDFGSYFTNLLKRNLSRYPDEKGYKPLISIIKESEEKVSQRIVKDENICITGGCTEGVFYALGSLFSPKDRVLMNDLSFEGFSKIISNLGLSEKRVNFNNLSLTESSVKKYKPKAVIFSTPENPSGKIYKEDFLQFLAFLSRKYNIIIITDEINNQNIYPHFSFVPPCKYIPSKNLVTVNSFTKNYFLPGIRLGWLVSGKEIVNKVQQTRLSFESGANFISQYLAYLAIKKHTKEITKARENIIIKKEIAEKTLIDIGLRFLNPVEGGTVFFVDIGDDSFLFSKNIARDYNIGLVPGTIFGQKWSNWVRIGFGALTASEIENGIKKIGKYRQIIRKEL